MTRPSQPTPQAVTVCHLGRVAYGPTWDLQKQVQARLIAAKRQPVALPHVVLLVEHPPVYTLGKSGKASNLLLPEEMLAAHGVQFYHVDRGGDMEVEVGVNPTSYQGPVLYDGHRHPFRYV